MKRGFATFLVILPIIGLAFMLTALQINANNERMESQLQYLHATRQAQIDNSIKKSLKEILKYYSTSEEFKELSCDDKVVNGIPIPGKITLAAMKISGFGVADETTWIGFTKQYYAKLGFEINFYATSDNYQPLFPDAPLTINVSAIDIGNLPITKLLLTCNPATLVVTNDINGGLSEITDKKYNTIAIKYTVKDTNTGIEWTRVIQTDLYNPKSE